MNKLELSNSSKSIDVRGLVITIREHGIRAF